MGGLQEIWRARPSVLVAAAIITLCLLRIGLLVATPMELGPDESQYWRWAQQFDWGYYSKPPLIAWAIGSTTAIFGDQEWAVRLAAPIAHAIGAFFLFLLGRSMYDLRTGVWSAAIYFTMTGLWLSSTVISTDALLLPLWSVALWALWRLRTEPGVTPAILLGVATGGAMLAKYAALYFLLGAGLAALIDPDTRRALLSANGAIALFVLLLTLAPNLLWNAANDFATVGHTSDNANWENATFNPVEAFSFIIDQLAVFGPLTFVLLCLYAFKPLRVFSDTAHNRERWLLCFIVPALVIITFQAFVSRAHANWAASAYPAACVLVAGAALNAGHLRWLVVAIALNVAIGLGYVVLAISPATTDAIGADNAFKRVRGWEATTERFATLAAETGATAILYDEREPWHGVDYYGDKLDLPPIRLWRSLDHAQNFAEETSALKPGEDGRVIVALTRPQYRERIAADFTTFDEHGSLAIEIGPDRTRDFTLFIASGFNPLPRDDSYFERFPEAR